VLAPVALPGARGTFLRYSWHLILHIAPPDPRSRGKQP
jgi:hypothetical protein